MKVDSIQDKSTAISEEKTWKLDKVYQYQKEVCLIGNYYKNGRGRHYWNYGKR